MNSHYFYRNEIKKIFITFVSVIMFSFIQAQDIPHHISHTRAYDFIDELANEGYIDINTAVKPYSRKLIAEKLQDASQFTDKLNKRQRAELKFFIEEFALELDLLPDFPFPILENETSRLDLLPPLFTFKDDTFRARIQPILGMHIYKNENGQINHRWFGVDFQASIGNNLSVYGSLRDNSFDASEGLLPRLSNPNYLTDFAGYEYKEPHDFSDSRGGIKLNWDWGSIGLMKDNIVWGDNYNGSNIISGRAPSFPMLSLSIRPSKWFEMNYIHGWLVSNVVDSARYYIENDVQIWYRNHNKYIAANMFTFTPISKFKISFGNSIIYAEDNVQPAYLLPIAFYKSIDHTLTKGIRTENQNSQLFFNISSRNIKHTHLYSSVFIDEIKFSRFKTSEAENNPISYKLGLKIDNFPVQNLGLNVEFTKTNIINYKHSISALTYASNSYNLGHYLGDNSQEIFASLTYKPIRGLDFTAYLKDAKHGNEYQYGRRGEAGSIKEIISQPVLGDVIWSNRTYGFKALYEIINNTYAVVKFENSNIQGFEALSDEIKGEIRMSAEESLKYFTPPFLHGNVNTFMIGLSFGF